MKIGKNQIVKQEDYYIINAYKSDITFKIDADDYDMIKYITWYIHKSNKVIFGRESKKHNKMLLLNHYILGHYTQRINRDNIIQYKNGDCYDFRKDNMFIRTMSQALLKDTIKYSSNTSGRKGVYFKNNKWYASIQIKRHHYHLYCGENKEDAISARIKAEQEVMNTGTLSNHLSREES